MSVRASRRRACILSFLPSVVHRAHLRDGGGVVGRGVAVVHLGAVGAALLEEAACVDHGRVAEVRPVAPAEEAEGELRLVHLFFCMGSGAVCFGLESENLRRFLGVHIYTRNANAPWGRTRAWGCRASRDRTARPAPRAPPGPRRSAAAASHWLLLLSTLLRPLPPR